MTMHEAAGVTLSIAPHPFSLERVTHQMRAGQSLADMMAQAQPDPVLRGCAHVMIDGHYIARDDWARVYLKSGRTVSMRMVPQGGGGGKNPLRTILTIAVMAASPVIAGSITGAVGATGSILGIGTAKLITGGVNILGRLALNAIAPPARPRSNLGKRENPVYFVQGAQNWVEHFARIPKVLGQHRSVPPLGAMPYTETQGGEQYLRMLFVWGYGPLEISDLKIGETPLSAFEGVEVETRQGYPDDAPLTLYSNAVLQNDLQVALRQSEGAAIRVCEAEAEEVSVDITFPRGVFRFGGNNAKRPSTVELEIRYAPVGSDNWSTGAEELRSVLAQTVLLPEKPVAAVINGVAQIARRVDRVLLDPASCAVSVISGDVVRDAQTEIAAPTVPAGMLSLARIVRSCDEGAVITGAAITDERSMPRDGVVFGSESDFSVAASSISGAVDIAAGGLTHRALVVTAKQSTALRRAVTFKVPKGQYQVQVRRLTADATDDNTFNECSWTALRTIRSTRPVRMQGLAMTVLRIKATDQLNGVIDRFNGVVSALIPDWNGSAWVVQPTSNPASIYRHVLQGVGNGRPLADSRLDIERLQAWHERCRLAGERYDAIIDHDTSVREILHEVAACGRASPALVDGRWSVVEDIAQNVPVQHFTPRNTASFEAQKAFDDQPQALRVRFINRDKGWSPDERLVFADGYDETSASVYETLELPGVTGATQAWRQGRYHLATALLRPETYQFTVDVEHLVCTRGDLVRLTHDVPMFGLASARIKAMTHDESGNITQLTLDTQLTQVAGKTYSLRCRRADGSSVVMSLQTIVGQSPVVVLTSPLAALDAPAVGDLAMFGESGQDSVALVVKSIEPFGDLAARVTCVDAAPEIYTADQGIIPPFKSNISLSDTERTPPAPEIAEIQSGEESLIRHTDGSLTTRIVITLRPPAFSQSLDLSVMIRGEGETSFVRANILDQSATQLSIVDVEEG